MKSAIIASVRAAISSASRLIPLANPSTAFKKTASAGIVQGSLGTRRKTSMSPSLEGGGMASWRNKVEKSWFDARCVRNRCTHAELATRESSAKSVHNRAKSAI